MRSCHRAGLFSHCNPSKDGAGLSLQIAYLLKGIVDILGLVLLASTTLFFNKIKKYLQDRQARMFDLTINKSAKVQGLLTELRAIVDSDRVKLFQLHNGEYFMSGESSMKLSLTHFYVRIGVAIPALSTHQNIPTTHFSNLFKSVRDHGFCIYPDPAADDPAFRRMMNGSGTHKALVLPVKRGGGQIWTGLLILSWLNPDVQITSVQREDAARYADMISDELCCPPK
jgi:hypothetical protein